VVLGGETSNEVESEAPSSSRGSVVASGIILPAQEAGLAFIVGGQVDAVNVTVGDEVQAGDVLVELENTLAQLDVEQAKRVLRELTSSAAVAAAERAAASAENDVEDAQNKVYALDYPRASDTTLDNVKISLDAAKKQQTLASDAYRRVERLSDSDNTKAKALEALIAADQRVDRLQAEYDWYTGKPTESDAAIVRANLDAASAALQEARWYLAALKGEQVPDEATGAQLTQFQQAKDALAAAQQRFDNTRLVAPFAGTVAAVNLHAGEFASPGQVIVIVSNLNSFLVETTDLSELEITNVQVGNSVTIDVDALSGEFNGRVTSRGMSAEVEIQTK
jgi:multidrug resistance efflux pump